MALPQIGTRVPDVRLPLLSGGTMDLAERLKGGEVVLAFFKVSCPVCQFAFPFLERIHRAQGEGGARIIGVSQNDEASTRRFVATYGISFPVGLDPEGRYPASNGFGLTHVPSTVLIGINGEVQLATAGFDKAHYEALARSVAGNERARSPFDGESGIPEVRPG
jgi:peroxiredoxin